MKAVGTEIISEVGELLNVLRAESDFIKGNTQKLELLRELVVKRDDDGLADLLEDLRSESQRHLENTKRRKALRGKIALALGWPVEEVRLSKLEPLLDEQTKEQLCLLRQELQNVSEQIKSELSGTTALLKELSRFNSMILNAILQGRQVREISYSSSGMKKQQQTSGIVNMRL